MSKFGMGNCFPFIRKHQKGNKSVCVAILGLDNAGKTTAAKSIQGEPLDDIGPTIGFDNIQFAVGKFNINLYDLGGGRTIRGIWRNYLSEIYGLIYVIDSSDSARMEEARDTLHTLFSNPKIRGKPVLLLANKQDEVTALDEGEIVEILNLVNIVNENEIPCRVERCVAKIGVGKKMDRAIKHGLRWLLGYIEENWAAMEHRVANDMAAQKVEQEAEMARRRERVAEARRQREAEREAREAAEAAAAAVAEAAEAEAAPEVGDPYEPSSRKELERKDEHQTAAASTSEPPEASESPLQTGSNNLEPYDIAPNDLSSQSLRRSSLGREEPLPPPVLAGSNVRGRFYSPRGAAPIPGDETGGDSGFLLMPKPPAARLAPLEPSGESGGEGGRKKKKKKKRIGRKNRLAPDPSAGEEAGAEEETSGASMGSRTPSRPDLFITEQIYTLDELDEDGK